MESYRESEVEQQRLGGEGEPLAGGPAPATSELKGKTVLITGGTGSFGHAFAKRLIGAGAREIRIFSRDEEKQDLMRRTYQNPALRFYLGDVRDATSIQAAMVDTDVVFHAAALKQVPSCEFFPMQAVMTNVNGSFNVIETAVQNHVDSVVCLSTDKAVLPLNAMGMTKGLMEKVALAQARQATHTVVATVRYGNIMYSRGSVIPAFVRQIRSGGPMTVTNPEMTRFMLHLSDALDLVEFALVHAQPGDTLVRRAPAATTGDLAEVLKSLFGSSCPIEIIGTRHGEKLYETLVTKEELRRSEDLGDYVRIPMDTRELDYDKYFVEGDRKEKDVEDYTSHNSHRLNRTELSNMVGAIPQIQAELLRGTRSGDRAG